MNQSRAFCPECKKEVEFVEGFGRRTCPVCGFSYDVGSVSPEDSATVATAWTVLRVFTWVMVILLAIAGVGAAVFFIGCAMMLKGF
jgi:rubredoxin